MRPRAARVTKGHKSPLSHLPPLWPLVRRRGGGRRKGRVGGSGSSLENVCTLFVLTLSVGVCKHVACSIQSFEPLPQFGLDLSPDKTSTACYRQAVQRGEQGLTSRPSKTSKNIAEDPSRPGHRLFKLLPSGWPYRPLYAGAGCSFQELPSLAETPNNHNHCAISTRSPA